MKRRLFTATAIVLGMGLTVPAPASALDSANSRIVNYATSRYVVEGGFSYNVGTGYFVAKNVNVGYGNAFGEPGRYEPRTLRVKPNWCMQYHFHVYGSGIGSTNTICAGAATTAYGVFFGNGYNGADYDVVVTAYYRR